MRTASDCVAAGAAVFELPPDLKAGTVKRDGDKVVELPQLSEMQPTALKVPRWEERDKRTVVQEAERLN